MPFLQLKTWSPFSRLVRASLCRVRALLSEALSAAVITATAAAFRSLRLSVSHWQTLQHYIFWDMCHTAADVSVSTAMSTVISWPHCIYASCHISFPCPYSGLSEHAKHELHLSWIWQWISRDGQFVVELRCWAEKRREQRDTGEGSTSLVPPWTVFVDGLIYITVSLYWPIVFCRWQRVSRAWPNFYTVYRWEEQIFYLTDWKTICFMWYKNKTVQLKYLLHVNSVRNKSLRNFYWFLLLNSEFVICHNLHFQTLK